VFIETVGVGQDEVDVAGAADVSVLVLVPGTGDDVQALKAGVMEIADVFVVNKADRDGADGLAESVAAALALRPADAGAWQPPVLKTAAVTGTGVDEVWATVERFRALAAARRSGRQRARARLQLRDLLLRRLMHRLEHEWPGGLMEQSVDAIVTRQLDPYTAADRLLERAWPAATRTARR
jgi:LAO/AO transport system kinase